MKPRTALAGVGAGVVLTVLLVAVMNGGLGGLVGGGDDQAPVVGTSQQTTAEFMDLPSTPPAYALVETVHEGETRWFVVPFNAALEVAGASVEPAEVSFELDLDGSPGSADAATDLRVSIVLTDLVSSDPGLEIEVAPVDPALTPGGCQLSPSVGNPLGQGDDDRIEGVELSVHLPLDGSVTDPDGAPTGWAAMGFAGGYGSAMPAGFDAAVRPTVDEDGSRIQVSMNATDAPDPLLVEGGLYGSPSSLQTAYLPCVSAEFAGGLAVSPGVPIATAPAPVHIPTDQPSRAPERQFVKARMTLEPEPTSGLADRADFEGIVVTGAQQIQGPERKAWGAWKGPAGLEIEGSYEDRDPSGSREVSRDVGFHLLGMPSEMRIEFESNGATDALSALYRANGRADGVYVNHTDHNARPAHTQVGLTGLPRELTLVSMPEDPQAPDGGPYHQFAEVHASSEVGGAQIHIGEDRVPLRLAGNDRDLVRVTTWDEIDVQVRSFKEARWDRYTFQDPSDLDIQARADCLPASSEPAASQTRCHKLEAKVGGERPFRFEYLDHNRSARVDGSDLPDTFTLFTDGETWMDYTASEEIGNLTIHAHRDVYHCEVGGILAPGPCGFSRIRPSRSIFAEVVPVPKAFNWELEGDTSLHYRGLEGEPGRSVRFLNVTVDEDDEIPFTEDPRLEIHVEGVPGVVDIELEAHKLTYDASGTLARVQATYFEPEGLFGTSYDRAEVEIVGIPPFVEVGWSDLLWVHAWQSDDRSTPAYVDSVDLLLTADDVVPPVLSADNRVYLIEQPGNHILAAHAEDVSGVRLLTEEEKDGSFEKFSASLSTAGGGDLHVLVAMEELWANIEVGDLPVGRLYARVSVDSGERNGVFVHTTGAARDVTVEICQGGPTRSCPEGRWIQVVVPTRLPYEFHALAHQPVGDAGPTIVKTTRSTETQASNTDLQLRLREKGGIGELDFSRLEATVDNLPPVSRVALQEGADTSSVSITTPEGGDLSATLFVSRNPDRRPAPTHLSHKAFVHIGGPPGGEQEIVQLDAKVSNLTDLFLCSRSEDAGSNTECPLDTISAAFAGRPEADEDARVRIVRTAASRTWVPLDLKIHGSTPRDLEIRHDLSAERGSILYTAETPISGGLEPVVEITSEIPEVSSQGDEAGTYQGDGWMELSFLEVPTRLELSWMQEGKPIQPDRQDTPHRRPRWQATDETIAECEGYSILKEYHLRTTGARLAALDVLSYDRKRGDNDVWSRLYGGTKFGGDAISLLPREGASEAEMYLYECSEEPGSGDDTSLAWDVHPESSLTLQVRGVDIVVPSDNQFHIGQWRNPRAQPTPGSGGTLGQVAHIRALEMSGVVDLHGDFEVDGDGLGRDTWGVEGCWWTIAFDALREQDFWTGDGISRGERGFRRDSGDPWDFIEDPCKD